MALSSIKTLFTASALLSGESVLRKLVGLISTLILARMLMPEDFGIIAIALLVMGFFEAIKHFGGGMYLLRSKTINDDMVNTSWTIGFIASSGMAALFIIAIPFMVDYFEDDRLRAVLWVYSSMFIVKCVGNPGTIYLKRAQNYLPSVKIAILSKVISVIFAVTTAIIYQNYWALIVGQFSMAITGSIGSYFIHHHRPRFCLKNFREQWNFSGWWALQSIVGYIRSQLDTFIVSSTFDKSSLGSYHTIKYISSIPFNYLINPASEPLIRQLSQIRDVESHFIKRYSASLIVLFSIACPMTCFLFINHSLTTAVVLGPNWIEYSSLLSVFSLSLTATLLSGHANRLLIIDGNTKHSFYCQVISFILIYSTLILSAPSEIKTFASLKAILEAIYAVSIFTIIIWFKMSLTLALRMLANLAPIIAASFLATYSISLLNINLVPLARLAIETLLFFATYSLIIIIFSKCLKNHFSEWGYLYENIIKIYSKTRNTLLSIKLIA